MKFLFICLGFLIQCLWLFIGTFFHERRHFKKACYISEQNLKLVKPTGNMIKAAQPPEATISFRSLFLKIEKRIGNVTYKFKRLNSSGCTDLSNYFLVYTDEELKEIAAAGNNMIDPKKKQYIDAFPCILFFVSALVSLIANCCVPIFSTQFGISFRMGVGAFIFIVYLHLMAKYLEKSNKTPMSDNEVQEDPSEFRQKAKEKAKNEGVDEELIALYEKRRNEVIQYYKGHQN